MVYLFAIRAPGSELDGERFDIQSQGRDEACDRARVRVRDIFSISGRRLPVGVELVAVFPSREAYRKAQDRAFESGVDLLEVGKVAS